MQTHFYTFEGRSWEKNVSHESVCPVCHISPGVMSSTSNKQKPFVVSFDMMFVGDRIQVFLDGEADRGNPMSMGQG